MRVNEIKNCCFNNSFKNTFAALALNIRSMVNPLNLSKLEALILSMQCKPDVISISETWIKPKHSGPYNDLDGYKFVSNSRNACPMSRGWGCLLCKKQSSI